jgi:hypothetical protein
MTGEIKERLWNRKPVLSRRRKPNTAVALGHPPTAADKGVALEIKTQCNLSDEIQIWLQARMLYSPMAG